MKFLLTAICLLLISFHYQLYSQNEVVGYNFKKGIDNKNEIILTLANKQKIYLETSIDSNSVDEIECFAERNYCLVLMNIKEPYQSCIINAAYFIDKKWIQDYKDRGYFKISTGIFTQKINDAKILNSTSLLINYTITTSDNKKSTIESEVALGKHGFFECDTGLQLNLYFPGPGNREAFDRSIRTKYSDF